MIGGLPPGPPGKGGLIGGLLGGNGFPMRVDDVSGIRIRVGDDSYNLLR